VFALISSWLCLKIHKRMPHANQIDVIIISTSCIIVFYIVLRCSGLNSKYLAPFNSAVFIIGGNLFYGSIFAATVEERRRFRQTWLVYNSLMVLVLIIGIFVGASFSYVGLRNTAIVHLLIWSLTKYFELFEFILSKYIFYY